jgi:hypothetical protein
LSPCLVMSIVEGIRTAKTHLATWRLGEPQCPLVHQWVLNIEVVLIMEDGDLFLASLSIWLGILISASWGDRNGRKVNWGCRLRIFIDWCLSGNSCHDCCNFGGEIGRDRLELEVRGCRRSFAGLLLI